MNATPCQGRLDPDHAGRRGYGQKAPDRTCIPLCRRHHRERDAFAGTFRTFDHGAMRFWLDSMITRYQAMYEESMLGPVVSTETVRENARRFRLTQGSSMK
jgi:hypothetical protein